MLSTHNVTKKHILTGSTSNTLSLYVDESVNVDNNNTALDKSANAVQVLTSGDVGQGLYSPFNIEYSAYFDAASGITHTSSAGNSAFSLGTGDFTVEFWSYPIIVSGSTTEMMVIDTRLATSNTNGWYLTYDRSNLRYVFYNGPTNIAVITAPHNAAFGKWVHVALVRSGGRLKFYIDGKTSAILVENSSNFSAPTVTFGANSYPLPAISNFCGYISNFRITKKAVYTAEFDALKQRLEPIKGTSVLMFSSNNLSDRSVNLLPINISTKQIASTFNPFSKTVYGLPPDGVLAKDQSVFNSNRSLYFDGFGDYLVVAYNSAYGLETKQQWSVEFWVFIDTDIQSNKRIIGTLSSVNDSGWAIDVDAGRHIVFKTSIHAITSTVPIELNQWNHVAVVRDAASLLIFVNGEKISTNDITDSATNNNNILIGRSYQGTDYYLGYLEGLRISNIALYKGEFSVPGAKLYPVSGTVLLLAIENNTDIVDRSITSSEIVIFGNVKINAYGPYGCIYNPSNMVRSSSYFSGGYYYTNENTTYDLTGDFTIEFWMIVHSTSLNAPMLKGVSGTSTTGLFIGFGAVNVSYKFSVSLNNSSTLNIWSIGSTSTSMSAGWHHVAFTRKSGVNRLFIDGIVQRMNNNNQSLYPFTSFTDSTSLTNMKFSIGNNFNGSISELRIIAGECLYTSNYAVPTAPNKVTSNTVFALDTSVCKIKDNAQNSSIITKNIQIIPNSFNGFSSIQFNAGSSIVLRNNPDHLFRDSENYTVEFWFKPEANGGVIIGSYLSTNSNWAVTFSSAGKLVYSIGATTYTSANTVTLDEWHHVALVQYSNSIYAFLDGVRLGTASVGTRIMESSAIILGLAGTNQFIGEVANVRMVKGVALYRTNFTPLIRFR